MAMPWRRRSAERSRARRNRSAAPTSTAHPIRESNPDPHIRSVRPWKRSALRNYRRGYGSRWSRVAWRFYPPTFIWSALMALGTPRRQPAGAECRREGAGTVSLRPGPNFRSSPLARNHSARRLRFDPTTALQSSKTVCGSFFHSDAASTNAPRDQISASCTTKGTARRPLSST